MKNGTKDKIQRAKEWRERKLKIGWEDTPMGLLCKEDINASGMAWDRDSQIWRIPTQTYISDGTSGRKKGSKYWGTSKKFLDWRRNRDVRRYGALDETDQIEKEIKRIEASQTREASNQINVQQIKF